MILTHALIENINEIAIHFFFCVQANWSHEIYPPKKKAAPFIDLMKQTRYCEMYDRIYLPLVIKKERERIIDCTLFGCVVITVNRNKYATFSVCQALLHMCICAASQSIVVCSNRNGKYQHCVCHIELFCCDKLVCGETKKPKKIVDARFQWWNNSRSRRFDLILQQQFPSRMKEEKQSDYSRTICHIKKKAATNPFYFLLDLDRNFQTIGYFSLFTKIHTKFSLIL